EPLVTMVLSVENADKRLASSRDWTRRPRPDLSSSEEDLMTKIDPNLTSIADLLKGEATSVEGGTPFLIPWRTHPESDPARQQTDYTCSCGCGCRKGIAMAKEIQAKATALVAELTQLRARVIQLEKKAVSAGRKKAARKKK